MIARSARSLTFLASAVCVTAVVACGDRRKLMDAAEDPPAPVAAGGDTALPKSAAAAAGSPAGASAASTPKRIIPGERLPPGTAHVMVGGNQVPLDPVDTAGNIIVDTLANRVAGHMHRLPAAPQDSVKELVAEASRALEALIVDTEKRFETLGEPQLWDRAVNASRGNLGRFARAKPDARRNMMLPYMRDLMVVLDMRRSAVEGRRTIRFDKR